MKGFKFEDDAKSKIENFSGSELKIGAKKKSEYLLKIDSGNLKVKLISNNIDYKYFIIFYFFVIVASVFMPIWWNLGTVGFIFYYALALWIFGAQVFSITSIISNVKELERLLIESGKLECNKQKSSILIFAELFK